MLKHPLQNKWAMWFFKNDKSKDWASNLRYITSFDTVKDWASNLRYITSFDT